MKRAIRNISRRKMRTLLVIIALGFSMSIMISIPAGISANQASTEVLTQNLGGLITQTESALEQAITQIDCSLAPSFSGFGFGGGFRGFGGAPPGDFQPPDNLPSQGSFQPPEGFSRGFGAGAFGDRGSEPMNESLYTDINTVANVVGVASSLQVSEGTNQTISAPNGMTFERLVPEYLIEGITLDSNLIDNYPILPTNITEGRNLQSGDVNVVILSENNTAYFGASVGDIVTVMDYDFEVVGIHGTTGIEDYMTLYMNIEDLQTISNNTGYITSLTVFSDSSSTVTEVANAISELHPELTVLTSQQRLDQLEDMKDSYQIQLDNAEQSLAQTESMAFQEIAIALVATSLIVLFVMLYTVRERTKEVGTLKAIGFSNGNIMGQFVLEGAILSLFAGLVGIIIGVLAAPILSGLLLPAVNSGSGGAFARATTRVAPASISLTPELMLLTFGIALTLGILGSLYPAWRASRTSPMEALRYE